MKPYDYYILFLCLVVFILLVVSFALLIAIIVRNAIRLVRYGAEDSNLIDEFKQSRSRKKMSGWGILNKVVTITLSVAMLILLTVSIYINIYGDKKVGDRPIVKSVLSNSMSYKNERNTYLVENNINNQIQTHDLVLLRKLPNEFDIKLYDIIMYEIRGDLVLHRVVKIEEPNQNHPEHRKFVFQGDAVPLPDTEYVLYSQMKGIYKDEKIPFIGSFINFMQSPAGWTCLFLVIVVTIAMPILDRKLLKAKTRRLVALSATNEVTVQEKIQHLREMDSEISQSYNDIADSMTEEEIDEMLSRLLNMDGGELLSSLPTSTDDKLELIKDMQRLKVDRKNFEEQLARRKEEINRQLQAIRLKEENEKTQKLLEEKARLEAEKKQIERQELHAAIILEQQKYQAKLIRDKEKESRKITRERMKNAQREQKSILKGKKKDDEIRARIGRIKELRELREEQEKFEMKQRIAREIQEQREQEERDRIKRLTDERNAKLREAEQEKKNLQMVRMQLETSKKRALIEERQREEEAERKAFKEKQIRDKARRKEALKKKREKARLDKIRQKQLNMQLAKQAKKEAEEREEKLKEQLKREKELKNEALEKRANNANTSVARNFGYLGKKKKK